MKFDNYLLKLENLNNKRDKENVCLHGVSSVIKSIYLDIKNKHKREMIKMLFKEINSPYQTIYSWISGSNPIPISKAYRLLNLWKESCGKNKEEFVKKWNQLYKINQGYSQCAERKVILPREFNEDLAYLIGFFQGDGHLKKEKLRGFQEYSLYFYEANKEVLDRLNEAIHRHFGIYGNIYFQIDKTGKWYTLRICSKPIYLFFKDILELKAGKKVRNIRVPEIIKRADKDLQLSFIRGFFDAEGGVGETIKNPWLDIGQASKDKPPEILLWIRRRLTEEEIILSEPKRNSNQEYFRIRTAKRETIKRFFEVVSSNHQEKINKFGEIINKNARS